MKQKTSPFHSLEPKEKQIAYELAFLDKKFLLRNELRPIRLQLELLKAELVQRDEGIDSTVVVFGSARIQAPEEAEKSLDEVKKELAKNPEDPVLQKKARIAEQLCKKSTYYIEARRLGQIISRACQPSKRCHFVISTGGGPGVMEAANRGAHDVGAKSVALNIILPNEQEPNPYITPELCFQFHYFAIRKMHFLIRARAMVFFPGGFGTLDELFETLTLMQTEKIHKLPVILVGKSYWEKLIDFNFLVEEGTIDVSDLKLFQYAETAEEIWKLIGHFYSQHG